MKMSEAIKQRAKDWINVQFGSELGNLGKCHEIYKEWSEKKENLEKTLASVSSEVPSKISEAACNIDEACTSIMKHLKNINVTLERMELQSSSTEDLYYSLKEYFDKINELDRFLSYLQVLRTAQEASNNAQLYLSTPDIDKAIFQYKLLCRLSLSLQNSKCSHLKSFLIETTKHWHGILKKIVSSEFSESLKAVYWPLIGNNLTSTPSTDAVTRFQGGVKRLLKVQLPAELDDKPVVSSCLQLSFPVLSLPVVQLLLPLRKRFFYHFFGNRQTNRIDKPEWYFTQILTWIRDHEAFLQTWVQPLYNDLKVDRNVVVEFMSGLVELSVEKLQADLEEVQYDDALFSHTVDEALGYEKELRQVHFYPPSLPSPLHVLTQAQLFIKWIKLERKFAREKMEAMLMSETAWSPLSGLDDDKVTEVAQTFLALLSTMTDRYSLLPQPGHRLQFVKLELELIDDMRLSILQTLHSINGDPISSKIPAIMNTILYLKTVLEQYDASPGILLLQHYESQYSTDKTEADVGLFHEAITLLDRLHSQILEELSAAVLMEVKARSRPYRKYSWFSLEPEDFDDSCVTQEACPMFQALTDNLHKLNDKLSEKNFNLLWKNVASLLNNFLFEEVVLDSTFSPTGGRLLEKDITKFLLPLFQQYTPSPHYYFLKTSEACALLSIPELPPNIKRAVLSENYHEMKIGLPIIPKELNWDQVLSVLKHRLDVSPSLM